MSYADTLADALRRLVVDVTNGRAADAVRRAIETLDSYYTRAADVTSPAPPAEAKGA